MREISTDNPQWPSFRQVLRSAAYSEASAIIDGGQAVCIIDDELEVGYPLVIRDGGPPRANDVISPYGYGGPEVFGEVTNSQAASALIEFRKRFGDWARETGVTTEFLRSFPGAPVEPSAFVNRSKTVFSVDLEAGPEAAFTRAEGRHRTAVRKAKRLGFSVVCEPRNSLLDSSGKFRSLYSETMERVNSGTHLRVGDRYFRILLDLEEDEILVLSVAAEEKLASSAIILLSPSSGLAHYHLSGSTSEGLKVGANNLLLDAASHEAAKRGLKRLHLGGGLAEGDGLERFKRSVSTDEHQCNMSGFVHNPHAYEELVELSGSRSSSFFPAYREVVYA